MNIKRLQHLRDVVVPLAREKDSEGKLDFAVFCDYEADCGTVACLAGWAASTKQLQEDGWIFNPEASHIYYTNSNWRCDEFEQLAEYYEISRDLSSALFHSDVYTYGDVYREYGIDVRDYVDLYAIGNEPGQLDARVAILNALLKEAEQ